MKQVTVTVPATTANLGPGFDCLGLALGLHNRVTMTAVADGLTISVSGEGQDHIPTDAANLVRQAAERVFERVGWRPTGLRIVQQNDIPVGSGLGSSAAASLAGVVAANALAGNPLASSDLLVLAIAIEGHPDNVVPAYHGGLTLATPNGARWQVETIPVPEMRIVVALPEFDLPTVAARRALPEQVPMADAVFNIGRSVLVVQALARGDLERLRVAMQDRLHQPYRLPLIPGAEAALVAAQKAGAAAVTLSGAGPSLAAFAATDHEAIGQAMQGAFAAAGLSSRFWVLPVDDKGITVDVLAG